MEVGVASKVQLISLPCLASCSLSTALKILMARTLSKYSYATLSLLIAHFLTNLHREYYP